LARAQHKPQRDHRILALFLTISLKRLSCQFGTTLPADFFSLLHRILSEDLGSRFALKEFIEMLASPAKSLDLEPVAASTTPNATLAGAQAEEVNVPLAPDELASLGTLMQRYDNLLAEMDLLNERLEEILTMETPARTSEPPSTL
jgi:hypothetical protein